MPVQINLSCIVYVGLTTQTTKGQLSDNVACNKLLRSILPEDFPPFQSHIQLNVNRGALAKLRLYQRVTAGVTRVRYGDN